MAMNRDLIGRSYAPSTYEIKEEAMIRYALATNETHPRLVDPAVEGGLIAPPVFPVVYHGKVLGKPIGILGFVAIAVAAGVARLPKDVSWWQLLGVSFACGIGFTMSLFIAGLAFEHGSGAYFAGDRLGILLGSVVSALIAAGVLYFSLPASAPETGGPR